MTGDEDPGQEGVPKRPVLSKKGWEFKKQKCQQTYWKLEEFTTGFSYIVDNTLNIIFLVVDLPL